MAYKGFVAFDGNSMTRGQGSSDPATKCYPARVLVALSSTWDGIEYGVNGQTTSDMAGDAASQIDPNIGGNFRPKHVLCAWEIRNELYNGVSAATALANFKSYCAARRAAGWYVVVLTILPSTYSGTPGGYETDRQTVNTELRNAANIGVSWDAVADVAADHRIGDAGDDSDTTYYPDLLHLNDAGYQIVADIVAPVIAASWNGTIGVLEGLVSYWPMDEASGDRADSHGSNTLSDGNAVTSATGKLNLAADFERSNVEYLTHANNASLQTGDIDYSFSFWINPESFPSIGVIVSKDHFGVAREYTVYIDGASINFVMFDGASTPRGGVTWSGTPSAGTWYHVVCWHDSVNNQVGMVVNNGTPDTSSTSGAGGASSLDFYVGINETGSSTCYDGLIDELGFWKRVLLPADITALYGGGTPLAYPFTSPTSMPRAVHHRKQQRAA